MAAAVSPTGWIRGVRNENCVGRRRTEENCCNSRQLYLRAHSVAIIAEAVPATDIHAIEAINKNEEVVASVHRILSAETPNESSLDALQTSYSYASSTTETKHHTHMAHGSTRIPPAPSPTPRNSSLLSNPSTIGSNTSNTDKLLAQTLSVLTTTTTAEAGSHSMSLEDLDDAAPEDEVGRDKLQAAAMKPVEASNIDDDTEDDTSPAAVVTNSDYTAPNNQPEYAHVEEPKTPNLDSKKPNDQSTSPPITAFRSGAQSISTLFAGRARKGPLILGDPRGAPPREIRTTKLTPHARYYDSLAQDLSDSAAAATFDTRRLSVNPSLLLRDMNTLDKDFPLGRLRDPRDIPLQRRRCMLLRLPYPVGDITLKVLFPSLATFKYYKFRPDLTVAQAIKKIKERKRVAAAIGTSPSSLTLFITPCVTVTHPVQMEPNYYLWQYDLRFQQSVELRRFTEPADAALRPIPLKVIVDEATGGAIVCLLHPKMTAFEAIRVITQHEVHFRAIEASADAVSTPTTTTTTTNKREGYQRTIDSNTEAAKYYALYLYNNEGGMWLENDAPLDIRRIFPMDIIALRRRPLYAFDIVLTASAMRKHTTTAVASHTDNTAITVSPPSTPTHKFVTIGAAAPVHDLIAEVARVCDPPFPDISRLGVRLMPSARVPSAGMWLVRNNTLSVYDFRRGDILELGVQSDVVDNASTVSTPPDDVIARLTVRWTPTTADRTADTPSAASGLDISKFTDLLMGEVVIQSADNVRLVDLINDKVYPKLAGGVSALASATTASAGGRLWVTNYRLVFGWFDLKKRCERFFELPLGVIARIEKLGSRSGAASRYFLELTCKDLRVLRLLFPLPTSDGAATPGHAAVDDGDSDDIGGSARRRIYQTLIDKELLFPPSITELFAFYYKPTNPVEAALNRSATAGWRIYDFDREISRQEVPPQWRVTDINADYDVCPSYPSRLIVPRPIDDDILARVFRFRSKGRIPVLCYYHRVNGASITRSSQPLVGLTRARCLEDETLLDAIRLANPNAVATLRKLSASTPGGAAVDADNGPPALKLWLLDARPKTNALANTAMGAGFESEGTYSTCRIEFLNIANIHAMRESLNRLAALVQSTARAVRGECGRVVSPGGAEADVDTADGTAGNAGANWLAALDSTRWLEHMRHILRGVQRVVDLVDTHGASVLLHCSDGWDRTPQLSSLSMMCLDPYYRTMEGFAVLVEKEWLSFGHKFAQRYGHADKNFDDNQRAPIFVQFCDAVFQLMTQNPCAFEFNEDFLITVLDHLYSNRFGTFLCNSERERHRQYELAENTVSLWAYTAPRAEEFKNPFFVPSPGVLRPSAVIEDLVLWKGYYMRWHRKNTKRLAKMTQELRALQLVGTVTALEERVKELEKRLGEKEKELQMEREKYAKEKEQWLANHKEAGKT